MQDENSSNLIYRYRHPAFRSECKVDPVPFDFFMRYYVFDDIEEEARKQRLLKLLEAGRKIKYDHGKKTLSFDNFDLVLEDTNEQLSEKPESQTEKKI